MKIAAFYSDSPFAGWVQAEGFCDVLSRMGHEVVPIAVPPTNQVTRALAEKVNKRIDDAEMVIVSGPEHLRKWINTFYPDFSKLKMPKVAWYHESFEREDYTLDYRNFEGLYDFHFFPDKSDAEKYKGEWLPLGCDTVTFQYHEDFPTHRDIDVAFIGLMYPKRARFVQELTEHLGDIKIDYRYACQSEKGLVPAIAVYDFDGLNVRRSMELLAETYRRIKVFVTFPSLSNVLVAKVLESLACGCSLVAPKQPVDLKNYYSYESPKECAEAIKKVIAEPISGVSEVYEKHRMELRFEQIFQKAGVCLTSS